MSLSEITAASVTLSPSSTYYAKIQLTGAEDTFGSTSDVAAQLTGLGFTGVNVWTSAPALFPDRSAYASGSTYWASGRYSGAAQSVGLPSEIKRVWVDQSAQPAPTPPGGYTTPPDFVGPPAEGWSWTTPAGPSVGPPVATSTPGAPSATPSAPSAVGRVILGVAGIALVAYLLSRSRR